MTRSHPRALILGCAGRGLTLQEQDLFRTADPWGVILFARNVETPDQLLDLTDALREVTGRADLPVLIDQEGGRVQRMRSPFWRDWSPALDQCQTARDPARAMYLRGRLIAAELRACGIDVNCAPLADIATGDTHPVLRNRCYGTDASTVIRNARAMADGLLAGGVLPVLKHIPGHGRAVLDSHTDLPVIDAACDVLRDSDFRSFRALADLPLGMTAHLIFAHIDPAAPATQSRRMIELIRNEIGFGGLLMTDDISMQALQGTVAERATRALAAGCDLVLHCNGDLAEMAALVECCPRLDAGALSRSERAMNMCKVPDGADTGSLDREFADLVVGEAAP